MKPLRLLFVAFFALSSAVALSSAAPLPTAYANTHVPAGLSTAAWAALQSFLPSDYLKASNTDTGDELGYAVAVDGDTVIVGARFEDSNATGVNNGQMDNTASDAGAVYVFTRTGGVWSQQAYLKASNTEADDYFGFAVAIDGDTIVVGAPFEIATPRGSMATKRIIRPVSLGRPMSSPARAGCGASRRTSKRLTQRRLMCLARPWP